MKINKRRCKLRDQIVVKNMASSSHIFAVGCNKKGELGTGDLNPSPYLQPIYFYVYTEIFDTADISDAEGLDPELPRSQVSASLQNVVSKIPQGVSIHSLKGVCAGSCGSHFTVLCSDNGNILFAGSNESGQLGIDSFVGKLPLPLYFHIATPRQRKIRTVSCGFDHTVQITDMHCIRRIRQITGLASAIAPDLTSGGCRYA
jgi:alpha-tubulin suppressor-like RCC1 family protein